MTRHMGTPSVGARGSTTLVPASLLHSSPNFEKTNLLLDTTGGRLFYHVSPGKTGPRVCLTLEMHVC